MQDNVNLYKPEYVGTQTYLNEITKNIYNNRVLDFQQPQNDLFDVIRSKSETVKCNTEGQYVSYIKDSWGSSVVPGGRNTTLPNGDYSLDTSKFSVGIVQYYANAELTAHDMDFEGNGGGTLLNINVVSDALDKMLADIKWSQTCWAFGDGTGQLATVYVDEDDTPSAVSVGNDVTFELSNTYLDLGIDGAKFIPTNKLIDIYASDGTTYKATVLTKYIKRQRIRVSGAREYITATVMKVATGASTYTPVNGHKIYGAGWNERDGSGYLVRNSLMTGIRQIVNPVITGHAIWNVDPTQPFQNHHRGSELGNIRSIARNSHDADIFKSKLFRSNTSGNDIALVDADNFSTYDGSALTDWDFGTIENILEEIDFDNRNPGKVDTLYMNPAMAAMFAKIAKDKIEITATPAEAEKSIDRVYDRKLAKQFVRGDGTVVTLHTSQWINNNEIFGLCSGDLFLLEGPAAHFLNRNGSTWEPTYANNKDNYQAPYKGFGNMGAYRCDKCFFIQGLKDINN